MGNQMDMKYRMLLVGTSVACVTGAVAAEPSRHRLSVGPSYLLNARVRLELKPVASADPSAAPLQDRIYDDGYNRVDDSDNFDGRTSFYGYQNTSQLDLGADTLSMHRAGLSEPFKSREDYAEAPGVEARYSYTIGIRNAWQWGAEGGGGLFRLDESTRATGPASFRLLTDAYDLGGVVPPPAPYSGVHEVGPGLTRIDDDPARTVTTEAGTVDARVKLEGNLWLLRLGPWAEYQLTERLRLGAHAGFALVCADLSTQGATAFTVPGSGTVIQRTSGSATKWLPGGYAGLEARYELGERWSVFAGADWLNVGGTDVSSVGTKLKLDLSRGVVGRCGLTFSF